MTSHEITVTYRVNLSASPPEARTRRHAADLVDFYLAPISGDSRVERVESDHNRGPQQLTVRTFELRPQDKVRWHNTMLTVSRLWAKRAGRYEVRFFDEKRCAHAGSFAAGELWEVTRG